MISGLALLLLLALVSASPLERRTEVCGEFQTVASGSYSLLTNLWGTSGATSGTQCSTLKSVHGQTVKWVTKWTWEGGEGIKSFSNIQLDEGLNQQLSAISSMPSTWHWSQTSSGSETLVADIAYDFFTSDSPGGSNLHEAMIWLGNFNAGPISNYDADGPIPTTTNLAIAGYTWNLYSGYNGYNEVYSFLPVNGNIDRFSGDVFEFLTYLIDQGYISASEYLTTAQAGTEATCGSATFTTSAYSLTIN